MEDTLKYIDNVNNGHSHTQIGPLIRYDLTNDKVAQDSFSFKTIDTKL